MLAWLTSMAVAGTWVRAPGHAWVQVGVSTSSATTAFTEGGDRLPLTDPHFVPANFEAVFDEGITRQLDVSTYAEVGMLPELELYGSIPVRRVASRWDFAQGDGEDLILEQVGIGDGVIGARWGRGLGGVAVSGGAGVRLPLYDNHPSALGQEAGNADIYDDRPPLGQGTIDVDLHIGIGVPLGVGWGQVEGGVRLRNRRYGTQLPVRVQGGASPADWADVFVELDAMATQADGEAPDVYQDDYGKGPGVIDRQQWLRPGVGGLVAPEELGGVGLLARVDVLAWGRRVAATTTWTAAITATW